MAEDPNAFNPMFFPIRTSFYRLDPNPDPRRAWGPDAIGRVPELTLAPKVFNLKSYHWVDDQPISRIVYLGDWVCCECQSYKNFYHKRRCYLCDHDYCSTCLKAKLVRMDDESEAVRSNVLPSGMLRDVEKPNLRTVFGQEATKSQRFKRDDFPWNINKAGNTWPPLEYQQGRKHMA